MTSESEKSDREAEAIVLRALVRQARSDVEDVQGLRALLETARDNGLNWQGLYLRLGSLLPPELAAKLPPLHRVAPRD